MSEDRNVVGKVKANVNNLVDQSGDKLADIVDKVTDAIDERTGGGASAVTGSVDKAVSGALDAAVTTSKAASQKTNDALKAVKHAVNPEKS